MDFNEFNQWKAEGYKTRTEQEYKAWQESFKTWYRGREWTDWEKNLIKEQTGRLHEQKQAWFARQKSPRPTQVKNKYLLQDDLAAALTEYIKVLTELKRRELQQ